MNLVARTIRVPPSNHLTPQSRLTTADDANLNLITRESQPHLGTGKFLDSGFDPVDLDRCGMYNKYLITKEFYMPRNQVQFQKGQSLRDFLKLYGTEQQCAQALFQARWPQGFRCPACGYHKYCQLHTRKVFQCIHCKRQVSLTAGTLFEHTKLPLTTWYLAIYLLTQSKNGISAMDLMRQLGVSYNTAWMLKHKLMQAMRERDDSQPLGGIVEMDDAYLGGEASGGKRGRGADRKTPFLAAAQVSEDGRPQRLRLSPVVGFRRRAVQAWAQQHLRPGTIVRSDGLACFRGVQEAARCTHQPRVTGGGKGSCETPGLIWVNTLLGNVKRAMDGTYHACDARYAGRYLAEFAYRFNRRYQLVDLVPRLAYVAVRTPPLPYRLLTLAGAGA